jgi:hypothetical protein
MQKHYGTKLVQAKPMNRLEYNNFRGWALPSDENGADAGYLVEYLDGGKPNVEGFAGYVSWSPKEQFEAAYQPLDALSFGHAIEALKAGHRVARSGWNGKGMWLVLVPGSTITVTEGRPLAAHFPVGEQVEYLPHIDMKTADGKVVPWLASQTDVLANDWEVLG